MPPGLNDDSIFASLTPSFFSERKKTIDLAKLEKSSGQTTEAPKQEDFKAPDVEITESDRQFLKDLLQDYGKTDILTSNSTPPLSAESEQVLDPQPDSTSEQAANDGEGLFSRWAKKLGLKDDEESQESATLNPETSPVTEPSAD